LKRVAAIVFRESSRDVSSVMARIAPRVPASLSGCSLVIDIP
jgi:predicted LPLAT superfamily acyltransferase